jgi:cytochrome c biogenesis protein
MIYNTKCECGHNNPVGTSLCESCGKPVTEPGTEQPSTIDMRYEGVARRSQTAHKTFVDKIWSFFSSVKVGIYIIVTILLASVVGTFLPQENQLLPWVDRGKFYTDSYGWFGQLYYVTGFSNTFNTWWFSILLLMLGTSLVIASLDRVVPLYKALKKQKAKRHPQFILRQKVNYSYEWKDDEGDPNGYLDAIEQQLEKKRYKVFREENALLAEKGRFSRWGPYINHVGLIIFLIAALMRNFSGWYMDDLVSVMDGETVKLPGTQYYLKNEKFTVEYYTPETLPDALKETGVNTPKLYQTDAILYECINNCNGTDPKLKEVKRHFITVNDPLQYEGLKLYQFDYEVGKLKSVEVELSDQATGRAFGKFLLDFYDPETEFIVGDYKVDVIQYYPDFDIEMDGKNTRLITKSRNPNNPAFTFKVQGPLTPEGEIVLYAPLGKKLSEQINRSLGVHYAVGANMTDVNFVSSTTLNVRVDKALPIFFTGGIISMIGLVMGFYWQHRRIWILKDRGKVLIGAHTNKNWFGIKTDLIQASHKAGLEITMDQLKEGVK